MFRPIMADDGGGGSYQDDGDAADGDTYHADHDGEGRFDHEPHNTNVEDNQHEKGFLDNVVDLVKEVGLWFEEKMKEINEALSGMAMELENGVANTLTGATHSVSSASQIPQPYIQFAQNGLTLIGTGLATTALFSTGAAEVAATAYGGYTLITKALTFTAAWTGTAMIVTGNSTNWSKSGLSSLQTPTGLAVLAGMQLAGYSTSISLSTSSKASSFEKITRSLGNIFSGQAKAADYVRLTQEEIGIYKESHKKTLP